VNVADTPVNECVFEKVKLPLTKPVALTLLKTSVGLSSTVFTEPVALTPVSVTVLLIASVLIVPVAGTLTNFSTRLTVTV
jgi:hypothetical protein